LTALDHLLKIYEEEFSDKKGLLIIIDDINGLSDSEEFVDWYKKFTDTIAVNNLNLPAYFLLAGYPEKYDTLVQQEESFGSIFHHDHIGDLTDEEVTDFFTNTFKNEKIEIEPSAMKVMIKLSSGLPLMMQQIGESVFWVNDNDIITEEEALKGSIGAANEIGNKQIKPILNQIRSDNYEFILEKLVDENLHTFKRSQLKNIINKSDGVIKNFLTRMVELGILESTGHKNSGTYKFSNTIYYIYFYIKSIEKKRNNRCIKGINNNYK